MFSIIIGNMDKMISREKRLGYKNVGMTLKYENSVGYYSDYILSTG